ncbi:MAG: hypothetical protein ACTSRN_01515 [Alphaproteobacteria bacterium]
MLEAVRCIAPQVDKVFVVLNEYNAIPDELSAFPNVEAIIPDVDLKDAGKFWFYPASGDIVFTIDDDILYPPDYVTTTLRHADTIGLDDNVIGYQANAWVNKGEDVFGWRNFMFFNKCANIIGVDILGTGTACMSGANTPPFSYVESSKCYVDIRFSQWQRDNGNRLWTLPRPAEYLFRNLPETLHGGSIFNTFTKMAHVIVRTETGNLVKERSFETGKRWKLR